MHHAVDAFQGLRELRLIGEAGAHHAGLGVYGFQVTVHQVVDHDHAVAGFDQQLHRVGPDVAGTTGNQDVHQLLRFFAGSGHGRRNGLDRRGSVHGRTSDAEIVKSQLSQLFTIVQVASIHNQSSRHLLSQDSEVGGLIVFPLGHDRQRVGSFDCRQRTLAKDDILGILPLGVFHRHGIVNLHLRSSREKIVDQRQGRGFAELGTAQARVMGRLSEKQRSGFLSIGWTSRPSSVIRAAANDAS